MRLPQPTHLNYSALTADIERGRIKIPQFQRDFVWSVERSAKLLDSVVKGYPIGTMIFWATRDRLRSVKNIGGIDLPAPIEGEVVKYVLDGQQRLTSLFAALKGLTVVRASGTNDEFSAIYLDLAASEDQQIVVTDLAGRDAALCIQLRDLLGGSLKKLASYPEHTHAKLDEYKRRIEAYDFAIVEVQDVPIDVATEIFTRLNVGGQALSLFEIMVAKTYDEASQFDLAERFEELVGRLQTIDYETVSAATLLQLVSLLLKKDCKRQTVLNLAKREFIDTWPRAADAIERAAEYLRNTYRIPVSKLLPYSALLVPFGYFFFHHKDKPAVEQKKELEDFFWRCSLAGRYSSSVESKLAQDVQRIDDILGGKSPEYDWAVDLSPSFLLKNGWFSTNRSFVKALLCLYAYHEPKSFSDGAAVRISNDWLKQANSRNYHHFFPRAYLARKGIDEAEANNVLNITIVDDYLNKRRIKDKPPSAYMQEFRNENVALAATMATHLIVDMSAFGVWTDEYSLFLQKRADAVSEELSKRVIPRESDAQGQAFRNDDVEEDTTSLE
ncbi:DUF262 domain-containing protein [Bradyrhizobium sp. BRP56]|uniref:GmrSD restriction endonuclease domain-containing protein n=1 Tax=Bradyrhizobium sp. BRP56 TaxID=2793819 RepID=UPI001CD4F15E|nr:DUF262 domain-containing protein [Bradyrhizobium sp. BRP56]MCA1398424.1 DUF262 domain-containing protein [Bradyrhizobium sp. BRP56]